MSLYRIIHIVGLSLLCVPAYAQTQATNCFFKHHGVVVIDGACEFVALKDDTAKTIGFQITQGVWYAVLNKDEKGQASIYYNEFGGLTANPSGRLGIVKPNGACWVNDLGRLCVGDLKRIGTQEEKELNAIIKHNNVMREELKIKQHEIGALLRTNGTPSSPAAKLPRK